MSGDEDDDSSMMSSSLVMMAAEEEEEENAPKFHPDEKVFVPEECDGLLYEAVVKKTAFNNGAWKYLVHYLGWNARWDKWIKEQDDAEGNSSSSPNILKDTPETRRVMAQQKAQQQQQQEATKRKREAEEKSSPNKRQHGGDPSSMSSSWASECCELPFTLQTILVADRERVMRLGLEAPHAQYDCDVRRWTPTRDVHDLPATVTIHHVLQHYTKISSSSSSSATAAEAISSVKSFVKELTDIFEEALPVCLLYPTERAQFLAVKADPTLQTKKLVEIYGNDFLLRLFTRLPVLLSVQEDASTMGNARQQQQRRKEFSMHMTQLIQLLQKNRSACFKTKYRPPREEELNQWEIALRTGAAKQQEQLAAQQQ